ncbi:hypothetical protein JAO29_20725 [Edaphobacter sp. HDX4]|uniref:hypothetical protein n=1 Tax=Edaphobacter sp. HDX4 TaxID=2794064 RepID=UPI002FE6104E
MTVAGAALFGVSLVFVIIELVHGTTQGTEFLSKFVKFGVYEVNGEPEPRLWFLIVLGLAITGLLTLSVLLLHAKLQRGNEAGLVAAHEKAVSDLKESNGRAKACIDGMMNAAARIREQQTPDSSHTIKTIERARIIYRISKDFSTDILREYQMKANSKPVHFWESSFIPSDHATPMEYLSDIQFRVTDITNATAASPVTYLQTENQSRQKSVCIYFLPRLEPGDPPRTLQLSCKWPGYFLQIFNTGSERLESRFKSAEVTKSVRIEVYLEDHSGGNLSCEVVTNGRPHSLTQGKDQQTGWNGYVYEATNIPAGLHEHRLLAQWSRY